MQDKPLAVKNEAIAQILATTDPKQLEEIRVEYLGKSKGRLTLLMKKLPELPPNERGIVGRFANEVKTTIEETLASQTALLQKARIQDISETEKIDVTLPAIKPSEGHLHPLTTVTNNILDIFKTLGY